MSKFPLQKIIKYGIYEGKYKFRNLQNSQEFVSVNGLLFWNSRTTITLTIARNKQFIFLFNVIKCVTFIKEILFVNKSQIDSVIFNEV